MKKIFLSTLLIGFFFIVYGQTETRFFPANDAFEQISHHKKISSKTASQEKLPTFDIRKLIIEDSLNQRMDAPFRFGKGFDVDFSLADDNWENVKDGRLWSMGFQSEGAYSLNFVFNDFYLSDNAELYIVNTEGTMLYGPVTAKQNPKNGYFLSDLVQGDEVSIFLYEPDTEHGKSHLTIKRVIHAYKNTFPGKAYGDLGASGDCNNNIACFTAWDEESDAVALVLLADGTEWCSGSLLMTVDQSFRPYFLSAFHCVDADDNGSLSTTERTNAENWLFKFQYKMSSCDGSSATTGITYNGASFRAAWNTSDFVLMEMNNSPIENTQFSWLGWDRSGDTPTSGVGIHHPSGDVMKISFDNNQLSETAYSSNSGTSHWRVNWDDGVTEGGSSGSPLFDHNMRVIGQLHGGWAACNSSDMRDWYGCFHHSWTGGGTNDTRLSNWLDPCGDGATTTNTSISPTLTGPTNNLVCQSGAQFTVNNLPQGATVTWSVSPTNLFSTDTGTGTTFTTAATSSSTYGNGTVTATIAGACGNVVLNRAFWVGKPDYAQLDLITTNTWSFHEIKACDYTSAIAEYDGGNGSAIGIDAYEWNMPYTSNWDIYEEYHAGIDMQYVEIEYWQNPAPSSETINLRAHNTCGWSSWKSIVVDVDDHCGWYLSFTPNPANGETTLFIETNSSDEPAHKAISSEPVFDESIDWDIEVFDHLLGPVLKKNKLQGRSLIIPTSTWKSGIYVVRIHYMGRILTGKLVVEK